MDRIEYAEKFNELLDEAENKLSNKDFEVLLSRLKDMVNDYE